jgi:type IV pilus assembly protein PilY1
MTRIEIFEVTETGFNYDACQSALTELDSDNPNLGNLKGYVEDCMGYDSGNPNSVEAISMAAFNHSLQACWFYNKNGDWQAGAGTVTALKNDCDKLYEAGIDPESITTDDNGYICYGQYGPVPPDGFVGRCWEPAIGGVLECVDRKCSGEPFSGAPEICNPDDGNVYYCSGKYNAIKDTCNKDWLIKQNCTGGGDLEVEGWTNDDDDDINGPDACIDQAIKDYCGIIEVPQVIDPSDAADDTGEIWNAPAVLIDHGVRSQLNKPIAVLKGHIVQATAPSGLIEKYADKIRMGVMIFNDDGSLSECGASDPESDPNILYSCSESGNRDGGKIISYIDQSATHTTDLVDAINGIKATSWTPLAESIYNAIMYYTQNDTLRLDAADFMVDASHDPITAYCQNNNILVITEGASTADLNSDVSSFVGTAGKNDGDTETSPCGDLAGSTYLDDLTYYAWQGTDIYGVGITNPNQNIMTHIVIAGTMRDTGTDDECNPETLLTGAALNGGTEVRQHPGRSGGRIGRLGHLRFPRGRGGYLSSHFLAQGGNRQRRPGGMDRRGPRHAHRRLRPNV